MKKLIALLLISTLFACSGEDDELSKLEVPITESNIEGTWIANDFYSLNGVIETTILGIPTSADLDIKGNDYNASITIASTPNTITSSGDITLKATISKLGFSKSETYNEPVDMNGQWTLSNNVLKVIDGGYVTEFEIVEFSGTAIKFKQVLEEDFDNVSGYSGTAKASLYIGFIKQ